jgi:hypothetical protein
VRIKTRVIGTGRPAACPKCHRPLTGPAIAPKPAQKRRQQAPGSVVAQPEPVPLVPVGLCAGCGTPVSVPREQLGRWIECSKCGAGFAAVAEASQPISSPVESRGSGPAHGRGRIHCVGLLLALTAVSLLVAALAVTGVMISARLGSGSPASETAAPPASESRKERLVRRLDEIRARIRSLEARRDELAQGTGEEDRDLDSRLAVNKELKQARDEEQELLAELERLSQEPQGAGR